MGESFDTIDWLQTIMQSPRIIPGMTTVQRVWGRVARRRAGQRAAESGCVHRQLGQHAQSAAVPFFSDAWRARFCVLSALRAGASVKVTVWSGKNQATSTPGFVRDTQEVMRALISYYGGGTQFPLHELRETYLETKRHQSHAPAVHIGRRHHDDVRQRRARHTKVGICYARRWRKRRVERRLS